jgi:hypothetical protein
MAAFVSGRELCRGFFEKIVQPIVGRTAPDLSYSAALIGEGSEVLGFDTAMSTDHGWAPRVTLFLPEEVLPSQGGLLRTTLDELLPDEYGDHPVRIPMGDAAEAPIRHLVRVTSLPEWFDAYLGFDVSLKIEPADWLTFPEQKLRTIMEGAVFHDDIGLSEVQNRFCNYPRDVWLYLLASGWNRIGQEEHLMGRAGSVGDEIGSAIIAARLVRDLMRLCFLMERQYAPYPKWFGTAFSRLSCAAHLTPHLHEVLSAATWRERERPLCRAYERVAAIHNALGITEPLPATVAPFFNRPFQVIHLHGGFADAIRAKIEDPQVLSIADRRLIGSIDQWSDSTDILSDPQWRDRLKALYR